MKVYVRDFKSLGSFIRTLRKRLALSQEELAEVLMVHRQSVSLWECNRAGPRTRTLKQLCELAEVDYTEAVQKWYS